MNYQEGENFGDGEKLENFVIEITLSRTYHLPVMAESRAAALREAEESMPGLSDTPEDHEAVGASQSIRLISPIEKS